MKHFALALLLLPACVEPDDVSQLDQDLDRQDYAAEQVLCTADGCLIHDALDRDHDGVSDDDELAAGTDPRDPNSRPPVRALFDLAGAHKLPSFEIGHSIIVVMPTAGPGGQDIFGGRSMLPSRKSLAARLGAGADFLGKVDLTQGLSVTNDTHAAGQPGMRFGRIPMSMFGAGDGGTSTAAADVLAVALKTSVNAGSSVASTETTDGGVKITHENGGVTTVKTSSDGGTTRIDTTSTSPSGATGDANVSLTTNKDGSTTQTTTTSKTEGNTTTWTYTSTTGDTMEIERRTTTKTDGGTTQKKESKTVALCGGRPCPGFEFADPDYLESSVSPEETQTALWILDVAVHVIKSDGLGGFSYDPHGPQDRYGAISLLSGEDGVPLDFATGLPRFVHLPAIAGPEYGQGLPVHEFERTDEPCTNCGGN